MVQRRRRLWNGGAIVSVLLATLLAAMGLGSLDMAPVPNRDDLRLSTSPRALITDPAQLPASAWSSLRGALLSDGEARVDRQELDTAPYTITAGVYMTSAYDLDLRVPTYSGNGYVWLTWGQPLQAYLEAKGRSMDQLISLMNGLLSDVDPVLRPVGGEPVRRADGSYYQLFTFVGRFYIDKASFRHYPFVNVSLPLVMEVDDLEGNLGYRNLRLLADLKNSGTGQFARIIGWLNGGWSIAEYRHHYATNFGIDGPEGDYSQIVFDLSIGTSAWAAFWRLLLPLAVLMAMVLLVFKVRPDEQDARASIPVTVLLTLVFLQQGYRDELPNLPFLTFLDQVYVVAYAVTLLAFVLVIWIGRRYADMELVEDADSRAVLQRQLTRLDDGWPVVVVVLGVLAILGCWWGLPAGA
ncbi:MAG: hypothetical protein VKM01_04420 [Cyanobacteriota bacterium]|nr:hypothetical protein [Cyanobacteriota bacterium]